MSGSIVLFPGSNVGRRSARSLLQQRLRDLVSFIAQEWRLRRDLAQLEALDTRALRDIGLSRGGLEGAIRHGCRARTVDDGGPVAFDRKPEPALPPSSWTEWR
jgi:uncharacterized protein YjiS (DUF1127 family)